MDQSRTVIESQLLDLTGVTLEDMYTRRGREWGEMEQRLLRDLGNPATSLAGNTPNSWTM